MPLSQLKGAGDVVRAKRFPESYPAYRGLVLVAETGELWVRRWTTPADWAVTVPDVLTPAGSYRRTVVLPLECASQPALVIRGAAAACVQFDRETGAESVVVARFTP